MKDYWKEIKEKKLDKKKILTIITVTTITIILITISIIYFANNTVREWVDKNIFRKEIRQDNANYIELKENKSTNIYAFNKYIGILNKNNFIIYNNLGNEETNLEVQVSNPIYDSANRFLAMAEKNGKKLYLIEDKQIVWETEVEGNILQVHVNKNGYVAAVVTDNINKTVVVMYSPEGKGKSKFKTYLSSTRTTDVAISNDNKYMAIAEVDTSGTIIQSSIRTISIDKASSSDATNSLDNTFQSEAGKLITNIQYQDKGKLICMYTDTIHSINGKEHTVLAENANKKVICQSIELTDNIVLVEEKSSGLFTADSVVSIIQTDNKTTKEYTVEAVTKEIYTYGNIIALNLGTEIEFINTDGWLVKRYIANQEITNIVMSNNIAGIIYKDRVEIINL